jgi:hypothetical protein
MKRIVPVVAVLVLGAGCADHPGNESSVTADCASQIRVGEDVFTGYSCTRAQATSRASRRR